MFQTTNQYLISTCVVVSDFVSKFRAFQFLRIVALSRRRELKLFPTQSLIQYVPWSQTNPWQREQWDLNLVEISVEQLQMAIHCWKCWFHHHNAGETELAEGDICRNPTLITEHSSLESIHWRREGKGCFRHPMMSVVLCWNPDSINSFQRNGMSKACVLF